MILSDAVYSASCRPEVLAAVLQLYADVQAAIDSRKPICSISGKCCRFEEYGHRLFVTTIELAAFIHRPETTVRTDNRVSLPIAWDGTGCPFQVNKLCGVHDRRPFGCRIFFCDVTAIDWQMEQYEKFHDQLKRLHETLQVPYFYVEWRQGLRELEL